MIERTLDTLLSSAAESDPGAPALVDGDSVLTYQQLWDAAARTAAALVDAGVGRGDRVGLYHHKSAAAVAAIYGVLLAGAAYVPLDPKSPSGRIAGIVRDCELEVLVTSATLAARCGDLATEGTPLRCLVLTGSSIEEGSALPQGIPARASGEFDPLRTAVGSTPEQLAYVLYTSGSTGAPKGVMISHRNALAFVEWAASEMRLSPHDRVSSHAPFHFDLSIFDLFATASAGGSVALVPGSLSLFPVELARFIDEAGITVWYSVPSVLRMLAEKGGLSPGSLVALRAVLFAGEVFPAPGLAELMRLLPHAEFWNLYGPTETNVCTAFRVREPPVPDRGDIPIGSAVCGDDVFLIGPGGACADRGEVGEIYVTGPTVAMGYWNDPERTRERFVKDPRGGGERAYRTGDLAIEGPPGVFTFVGRRDHQVKSRGYRIELGEVEQALHLHPQVIACAVVALPDPLLGSLLHGHVVTREPVGVADLRRHLGTLLPSYMVPESFSFHADLPRTSTGKIDRQALAQMST